MPRKQASIIPTATADMLMSANMAPATEPEPTEPEPAPEPATDPIPAIVRESASILLAAIDDATATAKALEGAKAKDDRAAGAVRDAARGVWVATGNVDPKASDPKASWRETDDRPKFRPFAVALTPNPKGWAGHAGHNVTAAMLAPMTPAERAYWRKVGAMAKALERAARDAGFTPAKRTATPPAPPAAPETPATPETPAAPVAIAPADVVGILSTIAKAEAPAGFLPDDVMAVIGAAERFAPPAPKLTAPAVPLDIVRERLALAVAQSEADDALLAVAVQYVTFARRAAKARAQEAPAA